MNTKKSLEPRLFALVTFLHLLPVILLSPFVTLDGPAHLYNAHLIGELLTTQSTSAHAFFEFNSFPEPNWSGHLLLACLMFVVPALWAEKILLLLIILLTVIGYRKLILTIEPSAAWLSWLVFPFVYNFTFLLGFFNFSLAMALLPFWMAWWMNNQSASKTPKTYVWVILFLLFLYFSHLVVFLLAGLTAGIISVFHYSADGKKQLRSSLFFLFLTTLPGVLMSVFFVFIVGTDGYRGEVTRLPVIQLLDDLLHSRMLIMYNYDAEKNTALLFTIVLALLTIYGLIKRSVQQWQKTFLLLMFSALALVFILPDSLASGGILSVRLVQWFFLCWCIWLVSLRIPPAVSMASGIFAAVFSLYILQHHYPVQKSLSEEATVIIEAGQSLPENAVILPLNYSPNWLHSNMICYLGALHNTVVLDNYEATQHHFPIVWKSGMDPEIHLGNHVSSSRPCVRIAGSESSTGKQIKVVTRWLFPADAVDSCSTDINRQLSNGYQQPLKFKDHLEVFIRK